jgi:hypothetical protein
MVIPLTIWQLMCGTVKTGLVTSEAGDQVRHFKEAPESLAQGFNPDHCSFFAWLFHIHFCCTFFSFCSFRRS